MSVLEANVKFSLAGKSRRQIRTLLKFKSSSPVTQSFWLSKKNSRKALIVVILN